MTRRRLPAVSSTVAKVEMLPNTLTTTIEVIQLAIKQRIDISR